MCTCLLTRKRKKSFIFIYSSSDLIFLFYVQFEFRTILFSFPRIEREIITALWIQFTNKISFFIHPLRFIFLRTSYNFIHPSEREIIHSFPFLDQIRFVIFLIQILHYNFQHWKSLHSILSPFFSLKRHAGVLEPGAKRRIARGGGGGGGEALYHPKAIWERYFKFTSYPSGMFYKEIPRGSYASRQFSRKEKGRMRAARFLLYASAAKIGTTRSRTGINITSRRDTPCYGIDRIKRGGFGIGLWV